MKRNPYRELLDGKTGGQQLWSPLAGSPVEPAEDMFAGDFDAKGQLNAQDQKDAGVRIANVLARASMNKDRGVKSFLSKEARTNILASAAGEPMKALTIVADTMGDVVYKIVDYASWGRKVFDFQTVQPGEIFRIPKDIDVLGWVVAVDGQAIVSQLKTRYVFPGEFKNTAIVEIDILDLLQANWDVFDRGVNRASQQVMRGEDVRAVKLLGKAARTVNDVILFGTLNLSAFEDIRFEVEQHRLTVDKFIISRAELSDIVKTMSNQVDFVTQREFILAGFIGNILNAQIITSAGIGVEEVLTPGTVFAVTEGRFLGRLGERQALVSEAFNTLVRAEMKKGVAQYEVIGIGIANSRAVAMGTK